LAKTGGAEAFAKVKGATMTGTVEMVGHNLRGPVSVFQQGDKTYTVIELPGVGKIEEGFDGETAWEVNALTGPRIKEGEEKAATVRASKLGLMNTWREYYKAANMLGEEIVEGRPAWKVELLPKEGKPELFFFDRESSLLIRMTQTIATPLGEIAVDGGLADYRDVGGILTPFTLTQKAMSQTLTMHFDKIEWNPAIPASRFELPAAVRTLAGRGK
ncbi:MAG: hypothetical protein ABUS49_12565, partial [Acidobacteriota bacterium]